MKSRKIKPKKEELKKKKSLSSAPKNQSEQKDFPEGGFCVVGIGASAGGLEALEEFFSHVPPDMGAAFVVVQHLAPNRQSIMAELLQRHTEMRTCQAQDGMWLEPNTLYVIPPNKQISLFHGTLYLNEPDKDQGARFPIDHFFRSLAADKGHQAVCAVLSGAGTDGTLGLRAVKMAGGMTMVQEENSAKYNSMLRSAIATGSVDHILPAEKMPLELMKYLRHSYISKTPLDGETEPTFSDHLEKVFILLRSQTGHDFSLYKPNTICRRIERRMALHQFNKIADYIGYLQQNKDEVEALFKEFLIGVTSFFRDPEAFDTLQKKVIPPLFSGSDLPIRVWDAGCSTGEEAYSIAMLFIEELERLGHHRKIQIFATDIDEEALAYARAGFYPEAVAADISPERLRHFFDKEGNSYRIKKQVREAIIFAKQDLIKDPPFSKLDLLVCRNLLIYLSGALQKKILPLFHYTLNPGGYLLLGPSETVGEFSNLFSMADKKWKIFCRKSASRVAVEFPTIKVEKDAVEQPRKEGKGAAEANIIQRAEKILLDEYVPPSVIINEKYEIVHFRGRTGPYLEHTTGEASFNVLKMAHDGLRIDLRSAVHKAFTNHETVVHPGIRLNENGRPRTINLIVRPFDQKTMEGLVMILFEEVPSASAEPGPPQNKDQQTRVDERIIELEHELNTTKESLQMTIEELETSNEELKSTNEELQSTNEELQSTNEEMETSKEELQSINEELVTVNAELQNKIDELSQANNDMMNLLSSTEVGTIFLDSNLRIKRFTPAVTRVIHLIPSDIGRPISHIAPNLVYENLAGDIEQVLRTLAVKQRELRTREGEWYLMKILPYRTMENRIDGVVITFVNISDLKRANLAYEAVLAYTERIVEAIHQPLVILNKRLRLLSANEIFYRTFQPKKEESQGQALLSLAGGEWNIPELKSALEEMVAGDSVDRTIEVEHLFPQLGKKRLKIDLRKINLKEKVVLEEEFLFLLIEEILHQ